jgi:hypothetical protein
VHDVWLLRSDRAPDVAGLCDLSSREFDETGHLADAVAGLDAGTSIADHHVFEPIGRVIDPGFDPCGDPGAERFDNVQDLEATLHSFIVHRIAL